MRSYSDEETLQSAYKLVSEAERSGGLQFFDVYVQTNGEVGRLDLQKSIDFAQIGVIRVCG